MTSDITVRCIYEQLSYLTNVNYDVDSAGGEAR